MSTHFLSLVAAGIGLLAFGPPNAAAQSGNPLRIDVPAMPQNITAPEGHSAFLKGYAVGTQNFVCLQTASGLTWRFVGPRATLFLMSRHGIYQQITTHFLAANPSENGDLRPSWLHSLDTSQVWGRVRETSSDPAYVAPDAIPWLLLDAAGVEHGPAGGSLLTGTTFIQRLNTSGGLAPAAGCSQPGEVGTIAQVPYSADYFFYRPDRRR